MQLSEWVMLWIGRNRKDGGLEMATDEKKWLEEQMAKSSAKGNSPVETKKGGVNPEPVLKSPNEPQVDMQPFMQQVAGPTAQIKSNDEIANARKTYLESDKGKAAKEAAEKRGFIPEEYKYTEFNSAKAEKDVQEQQSFKDMLDQIRIQNDEHKGRMETARNNAKYNALGNLLVSLGQIAGGGKQTYVKPTTGKYLTESMAKADETRKMYDAVREKNQSKRDNALKDAVAALERQHIQNENMKAKAIDARNALNYRAYKDAEEAERNKAWLKLQQDQIEAANKRSNEQIKYQKQKDSDAAEAKKEAQALDRQTQITMLEKRLESTKNDKEAERRLKIDLARIKEDKEPLYDWSVSSDNADISDNANTGGFDWETAIANYKKNKYGEQ